MTNQQRTYRGRVWAFGDNINTDLMMPGFTLWGKVPANEAHLYCMRANRPEFAELVRPGDIVVGGRNFGTGSSRPAARNLQALGISCVVANSISPIFFRNTVNLGMPMLAHPLATDTFGDGNEIELDARSGLAQNLTTGASLQMEPIPEVLWEIIDAGGLFEMLKRE